MTAIVATAFQAIEGLASSGKKYGDGTADANSNTFLPLTGQASQDQHNAGGVLVLPMLVMAMSVTKGLSATGALTLPVLTGDGYTGGQARITLPTLVAAGTGTVPGQGLGALTLPTLVVAGSGTSGSNASAALVLPLLTVLGWQAGVGGLTLPLLSVSGSVSTLERGSGALVLPLLQASGNASVFSYPSSGALVLPMLTAGPYGRADILLPLLTINGFNAGSIAGAGSGAFEGWAMNVRNGHVTHLTNWPFIRIVKWQDKLLGVAATGLYLIGGTTDAGAVIPWEWRTGIDDMGLPGIKRVPWLYIDGVIDGEVFIITKDDNGNVRKYRYEAERGRIHMPHRRELGKGVRTRNMAFGMSNGPAGAFVEIDGLEPEATVTQRSI